MRPLRTTDMRILAAGIALLALVGCCPPPQRPRESMGPWAVGFRRATATDAARGGRPLPLAIWYPVEPGKATGRRASYTCFQHPLLVIGMRSDVAVWDAPISRAQRWPLVIFCHGLPSFETQSPCYMETLASQGFVVVSIRHTGSSTFDVSRKLRAWLAKAENGTPRELPDALPGDPQGLSPCAILAAARQGEPWAIERASRPEAFHLARPLDVWRTIDWMAEQARTPSSFLYQAVDAERVGVTGHSAGGYVSLAAAVSYDGHPPDPRICAILPIATAFTRILPDEALRTITAPALFAVGGKDKVAPWERDTRQALDAVSSPAPVAVRIRGAGHTHFADIDGIACAVKRSGLYPWSWPLISAAGHNFQRAYYREARAKDLLPPYEAQRILNKYAVAFFALHLKGDTSCRATLSPGYARIHEPAVDFVTRTHTAAEVPRGDAAPHTRVR